MRVFISMFSGVLYWYSGIISPYRNHPFDSLCRSVDCFLYGGNIGCRKPESMTKVENWPRIVQLDLCNTVFIWQFNFTISALLHFWNIFDSKESYAFFPLVCPDFFMCFVFRSRLQTFQLRNLWSLFINHIWYVFIVIILLESFWSCLKPRWRSNYFPSSLK